MNRAKKVKYLLFTTFIFALVFSSFGARGDEDDDIRFEIDIKDAYYMDFDNSGAENDVVVDFIVELKLYDDFLDDDEDNLYKYYYYFVSITVDLEVELELPSGLTYTYTLQMQISERKTEAKLVYLNHATELGWYETSIKGAITLWGIDAYGCVYLIHLVEMMMISPA